MAAKLIVSAILLEDLMFPAEGVEIVGVAGFDRETRAVTFEIEGPTVPDCNLVTCTITKHRRTASFNPVD